MEVTPYSEPARPLYTLKLFREDLYQVTKFKVSDYDGLAMIKPKEEAKSYDLKLENSFSRARSMIKQYGLCNPWKWFITLTLDAQKYDRHDLGTFKTDLQQFIRDLRKKYKKNYPDTYTERLSVLLVPETHKDGAWHIHGLLNGIPDEALSNFIPGVHPQKLIDKGYKNWPEYASKFGFCSLGLIRDQYNTVLYTLKYISKDVEALSGMKGQHLYMASLPLNTAVKVAEVFTHDSFLDSYLQYHGEFCSVGMVKGKDWTFPCDYDQDTEQWVVSDWGEVEASPVEKIPFEISDFFDPSLIDPGFQLSLFS